VWGGFTEAERLRLLATGWEDAADRQQARVDIGRLEARLGLRRPPPVERRPDTQPPPQRPGLIRVVPAPRSGVAPRPAAAR
jgi:WhiB family redox-sensing transcriptional regulator